MKFSEKLPRFSLSVFSFGSVLPLAFVFFLLFNPTSLRAQSPVNSKWSDKIQFDPQLFMGGGVYEEPPDSSTFVLLSLRPQAQITLSPFFSLRGNLWVNLNNSRTQTRFQSPFFSRFNLMELVASFKPFSCCQLEVGSINQSHLNNPLLIAYRSFPGAILYSAYESKTLGVKAKFQHTVPTSTSFETDRRAQEPLPSFETQGVEIWLTPFSWFKLEANLNRFVYGDLPSVVAWNSRRFGNTQVRGDDPATASFPYAFEGLSQAYSVYFQYTPTWSQSFHMKSIENFRAPADRRNSQLISTGLKMDFSSIALNPRYGLFFAESDSVPSLYSAFEYGRSNRKGQVMGLSLDFKEMGLKIHGNYYQADLIEKAPPQGVLSYAEIFVEVNIGNF